MKVTLEQDHKSTVPPLVSVIKLVHQSTRQSANRILSESISHPGVLLAHPGVILCHPGVTLGSYWATRGSPWGYPGSSWVIPGSSWVILGSSWVTQGSSLYSLGSSWVTLGSSWVTLGSCWETLGQSKKKHKNSWTCLQAAQIWIEWTWWGRGQLSAGQHLQ